jgi:hypothetical protein
MQYQITTKTVEEYLIAFPIKMEEVDRVIGRPTFTIVNRVTVALKTNCIAMEDPRSRVGRLTLYRQLSAFRTKWNRYTTKCQSRSTNLCRFSGCISMRKLHARSHSTVCTMASRLQCERSMQKIPNLKI